MSQTRHPGIYILPLVVGLAIAALATMWATGTGPGWLQVTTFVVALGILGFGFLDTLIRDVRHTHLHPIGRRAVILGVMVLETLLLFATAYLLIADRPSQMTGLTTPLDALYFTMTTLMTIGFGDIAAEGQLARGTVLVQMFFSVLVLTGAARLLSSLLRGVAREAGHHDEAQRH